MNNHKEEVKATFNEKKGNNDNSDAKNENLTKEKQKNIGIQVENNNPNYQDTTMWKKQWEQENKTRIDLQHQYNILLTRKNKKIHLQKEKVFGMEFSLKHEKCKKINHTIEKVFEIFLKNSDSAKNDKINSDSSNIPCLKIANLIKIDDNLNKMPIDQKQNDNLQKNNDNLIEYQSKITFSTKKTKETNRDENYEEKDKKIINLQEILKERENLIKKLLQDIKSKTMKIDTFDKFAITQKKTFQQKAYELIRELKQKDMEILHLNEKSKEILQNNRFRLEKLVFEKNNLQEELNIKERIIEDLKEKTQELVQNHCDFVKNGNVDEQRADLFYNTQMALFKDEIRIWEDAFMKKKNEYEKKFNELQEVNQTLNLSLNLKSEKLKDLNELISLMNSSSHNFNDNLKKRIDFKRNYSEIKKKYIEKDKDFIEIIDILENARFYKQENKNSVKNEEIHKDDIVSTNNTSNIVQGSAKNQEIIKRNENCEDGFIESMNNNEMQHNIKNSTNFSIYNPEKKLNLKEIEDYSINQKVFSQNHNFEIKTVEFSIDKNLEYLMKSKPYINEHNNQSPFFSNIVTLSQDLTENPESKNKEFQKNTQKLSDLNKNNFEKISIVNSSQKFELENEEKPKIYQKTILNPINTTQDDQLFDNEKSSKVFKGNNMIFSENPLNSIRRKLDFSFPNSEFQKNENFFSITEKNINNSEPKPYFSNQQQEFVDNIKLTRNLEKNSSMKNQEISEKMCDVNQIIKIFEDLKKIEGDKNFYEKFKKLKKSGKTNKNKPKEKSSHHKAIIKFQLLNKRIRKYQKNLKKIFLESMKIDIKTEKKSFRLNNDILNKNSKESENPKKLGKNEEISVFNENFKENYLSKSASKLKTEEKKTIYHQLNDSCKNSNVVNNRRSNSWYEVLNSLDNSAKLFKYMAIEKVNLLQNAQENHINLINNASKFLKKIQTTSISK